jgi:hypothetical protein
MAVVGFDCREMALKAAIRQPRLSGGDGAAVQRRGYVRITG